DDYVTIMNVLEGGPAAMAGTLTTNDRITGVGQGHDGPFTDVIGWRLDDVVQLIRGKAGTTVRLQVLPAGAAPGGAEQIMEFVRNKVTLEAQAAHKDVRSVAGNGRTLKIGVITVPGFYQDIAGQNAGHEIYRSTTPGVLLRLPGLPAGAAPGGAEKIMEFVRNKVTLEAQAAHKDVRSVARNGRTLKIGVITVPGFYQDIAAQNAGDENYRSTTHDVLKLLR